MAKPTISTGKGFVMGASSVIRWDDDMDFNGFNIKISKAVELGMQHDIKIAFLLEEDLKSEEGLHITFPLAILLDNLQRKLGSGDAVYNAVKV
jgi:hypothetical protein